MNSDRFRKIEEIYHAALGLDREARVSFLAKECGADSELRKEVEAVLAFENGPNSIFDSSPGQLAAEMFSEHEPARSLINKEIGRYRVKAILGEGGMGAVYLAQDTRLARRVALKVLTAEMVNNHDRVQRFAHEARAASALNHPHILTVYEIDEFTDDTGETIHFISMEFVDGKTLDELIRSKSTSMKQLLRYLSQVALGLSKAHSFGIVHRDLKPENIMVSVDGYAKILDFGLAKLTDTEHELHQLQEHKSRPGVILGTLGYISPEQARGSAVIDGRSDIFAFGCILYEALTKKKAFAADTTIDALHRIIHSEPEPIRALVPGVSHELETLVAACLQKDAGQRPQDADRIAQTLRRLADSTIDGFPSVSSAEQQTILIDKAATQKSASRSFSGQRRQVTLMFTDVSAILEFLEDFDPERSSNITNDLSDFLGGVISEGGSKIAERSTDTFLSVWGMDSSSESDPERSVRTALDLQTKVNEYFNKNLSNEIALSDVEKADLRSVSLLKIAISTGTILVGSSTDTGELITAGSAVNAAKRILSGTSVGEVLVSFDTYRHIRGIFQVEEAALKSDSFKRKKSDSKIYSIKGVKPRAFRIEPRGVEGVEAVMVGREAELIKMLNALDAVKEENELQVVTVVGEAGIGKSRLLFEFHDRIELAPERFFVFNARALETSRGLPFSLVRDLFLFRFEIQEGNSDVAAREKFVRGILAMTSGAAGKFGQGEEAEMKASFIGHLIGLDFSESVRIRELLENEKQIQERAFIYAAEFFAAISRKFPTVLYLDDLHWADDQSLNFLDFIADRCSQEAILFAEFTRPILFERRPHRGEGHENRIRLNLQPLSKRESAKLVAAILSKADHIPKTLQDLLSSNTEGNPFYVEELIKMFIEQGAIDANGETWKIDPEKLREITVPPTLTGVLQARLDKLSHWEKRILQRASVVGREFWDSTLRDFEEVVNVSTVLESLRRKELLFRKENSSIADAAEYVFKHALLRDVTYETVLLDERRTWHLETAIWFVETKGDRRNEFLAMIAEHFEKAGDLGSAAPWYGRAGEQARGTYAIELAETYFLKAFGYLSNVDDDQLIPPVSPEEVLKWKHGLARVYYGQARFQEAIETFSELYETAERLDDKLAQANALWGLSFTQFEFGETRSSLESAEEAIRLASDENLPESEERTFLLAMGMYRQGRALVSLGRFEEAISIDEMAIELLDRSGMATSFAKANHLHNLALSNLFLGRFREARKFELQQAEISREIGDLRNTSNGFNSLGFQLYMQGHAAEAIAFYEQALDLARDIGHKAGEIMILSNIAGARVYLGQYEAAETELNAIIGSVDDDRHFLLPEMYRFLTESLIGKGKFDDALQTALKSLALAKNIENQEAMAEAWRVLGITASLLDGRVAIDGVSIPASECFQNSLDIFERLGMEANYAQAMHNLAQFRASIGDDPGAKELIEIENEISQRLEIDTKAKCVYFKSARSAK